MFKQGVTLEAINAMSKDTLVENLGIEVIEMGENFLVAKMPVDKRTHQPMGLLHGGASVVLAETLGSIAATLTLNNKEQHCVGLEINANHVRPVSSGFVTGTTTVASLGRSVHVWNIDIKNDQGKLNCVSRLTTAIVDLKGDEIEKNTKLLDELLSS